MKQYVSYIRVSTKKQGASMLGLEAQQKMCLDFINSHNGEQIAEFKDVESGTHRDRKGLADALAYCKANGCALVVAKLDRLARDVEFCFKVINTGIEIHFVDMPQINTLLLGVFASVAQYERELTSDRTRKALAAKKARGEALGAKSEKWIESYNNKTKEQHKEEAMVRGAMKNERYIQNRDTQAFLKVLKCVFPNVCPSDDATQWDWKHINTKGEAKDKILSLMKNYKEFDESGTLFKKFDFNRKGDATLILMRAHLCNVRRSVLQCAKNRRRSLSTCAPAND